MSFLDFLVIYVEPTFMSDWSKIHKYTNKIYGRKLTLQYV